MLYASLSVLFLVLRSIVGVENDTKVVGSYIHELKIKPPSDLLTAASKKHTGTSGSNKHGDEGFIKSKSTKDDDGYNSFDTFHTKDGDSFGYGQHFEFDKSGGDKKKGGYLESNFDEDEAADSVKPKFSEWNFEESSSPSKYYRYENDGEEGSKGKLVGPDYVSETKKSKKRPKRKKEQDAAATEYENYDTYGDIEEADDGAPADFEAEDADPEYGNQYADAAEAYDYY